MTMGTPGLWKILERTSKFTSLLELSVWEGFVENRHGTHTVVVGVDASQMMYEAFASRFARPRHLNAQAAAAGPNPELRALFFQLASLSRSGVSAVFVFDGPNLPEQKGNKIVWGISRWVTERFRELITGFGFHCYTAPGEANAELAYLNASQAVDIVFTGNNDVFLFGAKQVIRSPTDSQHLDNVSVFTMDRIRDQDPELFTAQGLLLMAVMSGGGYDMVGLPNCGPTIASALAKGPLARDLYNAAKSYTEPELCHFLTSWRASLRDELTDDPGGRLGTRHPKLAESIPNSFPDPKIVKQYCCPVTSNRVPHNAVAWLTPQIPNTAALAELSDHLFCWGPNIVDRFISHVWDGYFIRKLIKAFHMGFSIPNGPPSLISPTFNGIEKISNQRQAGFSCYQVTAGIPSLTAEAATAILDSGRPDTMVHGLFWSHSMSIPIPAPILEITNPDLIQTYHSTHPWVELPVSTTYSPVLEEFYVLA